LNPSETVFRNSAINIKKLVIFIEPIFFKKEARFQKHLIEIVCGQATSNLNHTTAVQGLVVEF